MSSAMNQDEETAKKKDTEMPTGQYGRDDGSCAVMDVVEVA